MRRCDDFGRHVNRRAAQVAVEVLNFSGHRKMEIVELGKVLGSILHVDPISLHVSMDDVALVECCQTTQDVLAKGCADLGMEVYSMRSRKKGVQCEAGVVLLYQEELVAGHQEVPDRDDVRVPQPHDLHGD